MPVKLNKNTQVIVTYVRWLASFMIGNDPLLLFCAEFVPIIVLHIFFNLYFYNRKSWEEKVDHKKATLTVMQGLHR